MLSASFYCLILITSILFIIPNCGSSYIHRFSDPAVIATVKNEELKALARGKEIWFDPDAGTNGRSCESCHPRGAMTNAETYPRYKHILRTMATLSMSHNFAVVNESKGKPWELGSYDANALVLYVTSLANGKSIQMVEPKAYHRECVKRGENAFNNPEIGTNDLTCASCHHNDKIKQVTQGEIAPALKGAAATYPRYSIEQKKVITIEQQVNYCIKQYLNGYMLPLDHETIVALTSYLTSLSLGKKIAVLKF